MEIIEWGGWKKCARLDNGSIELIITLEVGPRIISCKLAGGENLFATFDSDLGRTGDPKWRPYGGHRLWHAPEDQKRTYSPDNATVEHEWDGKRLKLKPKVEPETGIQKMLSVEVDADSASAKITHELTNTGLWDVKLAPWALTVLAPGGTAYVPQEPFAPWPDALLPARPMVLWPYTNMSDARYTWDKKFVALRQDPSMQECQKIGMRNSRGWAAYVNKGVAFIKKAPFDANAEYPDFGCNWELYTNPAMLELESLGASTVLCGQGGSVGHEETWIVAKLDSKLDAVKQSLTFPELEKLAEGGD